MNVEAPLAPKDWGVADPVGFAAFEMFQVFKTNSDVKGDTTDLGRFLLHELFGRVEEDDRANVFIQFLAMLDEEGLEYDKAEFNVNAVQGQVQYDG